MNIVNATHRYEAWLAAHTVVVAADLARKHDEMAAEPFAFLRATFYRWAQLWPEICGQLMDAPRVGAVGDLHVENFGTWRDAEGRLCWGVNDFDEALPLPYTHDLVRLLASALVASREGGLAVTPAAAADAVLGGYTEALDAGGSAYILAEAHEWLRDLAVGATRDPRRFWRHLDSLPVASDPPESAIDALESLMPERRLSYRVHTRIAGLGSLGHQRWVAVGDWNSSRLAREAKALVPSAWYWARGHADPLEIHCATVARRAIRGPDPFFAVHGQWIARRLAPDCARIELSALPAGRDEAKLLHAMATETANVHLGVTTAAAAVHRDLKRRPAGWLLTAATAMEKAIRRDAKAWAAQRS